MTVAYDETYKLDNPLEAIKLYKQTGDLQVRNSIVMHYSYIARHIAAQTRGITEKYAQMEDMVNQGILALIDCIDKFNPDLEVKFESYAYIRVKGAMLDFVRKQDWIPRRVRKAASEITAAFDELSNRYMREPTHDEMCEYLGIGANELHKLYGEISNAVTVSFEDLIQGSRTTSHSYEENVNSSESFGRIYQEELREELISAIGQLSEREQLVMSLYYKDELKFAEIAKVLEVSEARICQIHSKAIIKLRSRMESYMKG